MSERLPVDWKEVVLGDVCSVQGGFAFKSECYLETKGGIPIVRIGDLQNGRVQINGSMARVPLSYLGDSTLRKFLLRNNDVLIAMTGATTGKVGRYRNAPDQPVYLNQRVGRLLSKTDETSDDFIFFVAQSEDFQRQISENILAAAQGNISPSKLESIRIPLPPLSEQAKITSVLGLVLQAIEEQQRLLALTDELKKSLLHQLFACGLRNEPQKQTELGLIPRSWDVVYFSDFVGITNGQVDPRYSPYREMLHVGPENIEAETGYLMALYTNAELGVRSGNYLFSSENVLYSKIRPYLRKAALPDFSGTCSADMYPLRPKDNRLIRNFLFHILLSEQFSKQAISFQDRTGIPKINRQQLGRIQIPIPTVEEQRDIANALDAVNSKLGIHRQKQLTLAALFRSLIHELMTARIRVNDLDL